MGYSVNLWGSHPQNNNDDCVTGVEYDTLAEAMKAFCDPMDVFSHYTLVRTRYVELDSDEYNCVREHEYYDKNADAADSTDMEWRREIAMQEGMAHGVEAYNDAMGWGYEPYEE